MNNYFRILLLILILSSLTYGQDKLTPGKESYFANGSVLVNHTTHVVNDAKATSFGVSLNPKVGYFLTEKLAIGAEIALKSTSDKQESVLGDIKTNSFIVGFMPIARYYIVNGLFGEAAGGISTQTTKIDDSVTETEYSAFGYGFRTGIGYALPLRTMVAIEPMVGYSWEKFNPKDAPDDYKETISSVFFGIGLTAYF